MMALFRKPAKPAKLSAEVRSRVEEASNLLQKWLEVGRVVRNWVDVGVGEKLGELVDER